MACYLSPDQLAAQQGIEKKFENGDNIDTAIIVTGGPGTGKSTLIKSLSHLNPIKLAYTNEAARNIGGSTIHAHFGIYYKKKFGKCIDPKEIIRDCKKFHEKWIPDKAVENSLYVIDEVSQVPLYLLLSIWFIIQNVKSVLVMIGDKDQVGPISEDNLCIFDLPKKLFEYYYLKHNFRCSIKLEKILKMINSRSKIDEIQEILEDKFWCVNKFTDKQILKAEYILCCKNKYVLEYAKIKYEDKCKVTISCEFFDKKNCIINLDEIITDKLYNYDYFPKLYFGSDILYTIKSGKDAGKKLSFYRKESNNRLIMRDCETGELIAVERSKFFINPKYYNPQFKDIHYCKQFPLKFFNIMTIFRCQGKTINGEGLVNLQGCQDKKNVYVAISRFTDVDNITCICY